MIKAFIFDLDGVLVDTAKYHFRAWKALANEIGIDFTEKENEQLKGISRKESLELILGWANVQISEDRKLELMEMKNNLYLQFVENMNASELLQGVKEFLIESKTLGLKIALGSASKNAIPILEKTNILSFFDAIVDGNHTTKSKPDPQVFRMGADLLGLKPKEAIVFEDSLAGVQAAKTGGFVAIGIGSEKVLTKADKIYKGISEIKAQTLLKEF